MARGWLGEVEAETVVRARQQQVLLRRQRLLAVARAKQTAMATNGERRILGDLRREKQRVRCSRRRCGWRGRRGATQGSCGDATFTARVRAARRARQQGGAELLSAQGGERVRFYGGCGEANERREGVARYLKRDGRCTVHQVRAPTGRRAAARGWSSWAALLQL
jgi:hypothetical protein